MVDKFIGDAVLAVFGAIEAEANDAARAIRCGMRMLAAVEKWSELQQARGKPDVSIGIGAHDGEVFVGAVGDERMIEFAVLGDAVNVAERLERLTRTVGATFVVSSDLLHAAGPSQAALWAPISQSLLTGPLAERDVFSLQTTPLRQQPSKPHRAPENAGR